MVIESVPEPRIQPAPHEAPKTKPWGVAILVAAFAVWFIWSPHFDAAAKPGSTQAPVPLIGSEVPSVPHFPAQYPPVTNWNSSDPPATY
jgi:hypothetical protein